MDICSFGGASCSRLWSWPRWLQCTFSTGQCQRFCFFCRFIGTAHAGFGQASAALRTIPLLVALAAMTLLSAPDLCLADSQVVATRLAFLRVHADAVRSGDYRSHLERDNTFLGIFADKASGSRSQAAHLIGWLSWLRHRAGNF